MSMKRNPSLLELRLGPPSKEEAQNDLLLSLPSAAQSIRFAHENHANFAQVHPPALASGCEKAVNNGLKLQHRSRSTSLQLQHVGENGGPALLSAENKNIAASCSQKRVAPPCAIGWPPIRSFRKKITSSSALKASGDPTPKTEEKGKSEMVAKDDSFKNKDMFVKINMDGVPIGRKVNLRAYDNYGSLSSAVDQLFRGLLAAQKDGPKPSKGEIKLEDAKEITGLLDGKGEYTLVYEDNEGDRVLVSDVPWEMFLSTVKRIQVLKSCELGGN